jgi:hypothetical protein
MEPTNGTKPVPLHTDKIVWRLDLYPELVQALREGDLLTGRLFCARLFNLDERRNRLGEMILTLQAAMKVSLRTIPRFI